MVTPCGFWHLHHTTIIHACSVQYPEIEMKNPQRVCKRESLVPLGYVITQLRCGPSQHVDRTAPSVTLHHLPRRPVGLIACLQRSRAHFHHHTEHI